MKNKMIFFYNQNYVLQPFVDELKVTNNIEHMYGFSIVPDKWHVMNRKDVPNKFNINPTAPLVLNWLNGLVA